MGYNGISECGDVELYNKNIMFDECEIGAVVPVDMDKFTLMAFLFYMNFLITTYIQSYSG